jgi:glucose/arabinose dehydrogenase
MGRLTASLFLTALLVAGALLVVGVPQAAAGIGFRTVAAGLDRPVAVAADPGDDRLFILEQHSGKVLLQQGARRQVLLDLGSRIATGGEQGLLGIALAPDFARSRLVFLNFTDTTGATRIERYRLSRGRLVDRVVYLRVRQPFANHNGGHLVFGPDGKLWVGLGDGGSGGDPGDRAQNPQSLLGKMLRLDPARPGARPAVWALGLRNPWRYSFDGTTLWIGDVGQGAWEEIDRVDSTVAPGVNFGWNRYEGSRPYEGGPAVELPRYQAPIAEYSHAVGCSVTGGIVIRDPQLPLLHQRYIYADYCSGRVWTLPANAIAARRPREITDQLGGPLKGIVSFGEDGAGRPLVVLEQGRVLRLVETTS